MSAGVLPKPVLRGYFNRQVWRQLSLAIVCGLAASYSVKVFRNDPKKKKYAEFYKNYDDEKEFNRMADLGLFDSVNLVRKNQAEGRKC